MLNKFTDISLTTNKKLIDEQALVQRVHVLFSTSRRERRHRPEYGSGFEKYLFELTNHVDSTMIKAEAEYVLSQEPSIVIQDGSEVIIVDNKTYRLKLNLYSTELEKTFEYIKDLKVSA